MLSNVSSYLILLISSGGPGIGRDLCGFKVSFQQSIAHACAELGPSRGTGVDGASHKSTCEENTSWSRS